MEHFDLRRTVIVAAGVVVLLGLAVGGGSLFSGTGTTATPGGALPFALVGAMVALFAVVVAAAMAWRMSPSARGTLRSLGLLVSVLAIALGALIGAGLAPDSDETDALDDEQQADEPQVDEGSGDPEDGRVYERADDSATGASLDANASVVGVDADGDGRADVDGQGRPIQGIDSNGDGLIDAILIPCGTPRTDVPSPGTVTVDQNCDGTADYALPFDADVVLGAEPGLAGALEDVLRSGGDIGDLGDLDGFSEGRAGLDESELTEDDLEALGLDVERLEPEEGDDASIPWGRLLYVLLIGLLAIAVIAGLCLLAIRWSRRAPRSTPRIVVPQPEEPEPDVDLGPALTSSLDTLEDDLDPRAAICAAYGTLLERLASSGLARRPEEAPEEHMVRCLAQANLPERPVRELLDLFTVARFSTHPITERHRDAAISAMREILAAIAVPERPHDLQGAAMGWSPPTAVGR